MHQDNLLQWKWFQLPAVLYILHDVEQHKNRMSVSHIFTPYIYTRVCSKYIFTVTVLIKQDLNAILNLILLPQPLNWFFTFVIFPSSSLKKNKSKIMKSHCKTFAKIIKLKPTNYHLKDEEKFCANQIPFKVEHP